MRGFEIFTLILQREKLRLKKREEEKRVPWWYSG